jgi:O-antigen/teichoic acid export membrane protein
MLMKKVGNPSNHQDLSERSGVKTSFWDYLSLLSSNLFLIPLGILLTAMTTRILGKEGYGYITIYGLVTSLVVMLTTNWTAASLIRFGREEYDKHGQLNHTFWARSILLIPCLLVGFIAVFLLREHISNYMNMPLWTVWLVMGSILLIALRSYLDHILQAIHRMKAYAAIQIAFTSTSIVGLALIFIGLFPRNYLMVIIVGLITNTMSLIFLFTILIPRNVIFPIKCNRRMTREVFFFSYPIIFGNLGAYIVNWIDVIVIKHYLSLSDVGGYQLAYNMFNLLVGLIGSTTILMTPILVSFLAVNREDLILRYSTRLIPQGVLLWTTIIGLGLGICPPLFNIFFGEGFSVSVPYFQFLAIGLAFNGLITFYSSEITAYKLIKLGMMASIARGFVNLMGDFILVPIMGPLGAAIATTGGIAMAAIFYLLICKHQLKEKLFWQLILILPALFSLMVSRLVSGWESPLLAIGVTLATSYYLARAFHLFRSDDLNLLDYIQMPISLKKAVARIYPFFVSDEKQRINEVVS